MEWAKLERIKMSPFSEFQLFGCDFLVFCVLYEMQLIRKFF